MSKLVPAPVKSTVRVQGPETVTVCQTLLPPVADKQVFGSPASRVAPIFVNVPLNGRVLTIASAGLSLDGAAGPAVVVVVAPGVVVVVALGTVVVVVGGTVVVVVPHVDGSPSGPGKQVLGGQHGPKPKQFGQVVVVVGGVVVVVVGGSVVVVGVSVVEVLVDVLVEVEVEVLVDVEVLVEVEVDVVVVVVTVVVVTPQALQS